MKKNHNYIDQLCNTLLFANATCFTINREKEYPFWLGCTTREKYAKECANERKANYLRDAAKRREFKQFADRIVNDTVYRNWIQLNIALVHEVSRTSRSREDFYNRLHLPMPK